MIPALRYHGWTIVGTGLVCALLSSPGQSFVLSLYLEHLIADTGLSRVVGRKTHDPDGRSAPFPTSRPPRKPADIGVASKSENGETRPGTTCTFRFDSQGDRG